MIKKQILNNFKRGNPSYFEVKINDADREVNLVEDKDRLKILCKPEETISIGDIIIVSKLNNSIFICDDINPNTTIQTTGYIRTCNNVLTIQDKKLNINIFPCIVENKISQYAEGIKENKYLTDYDVNLKVTVSNNEFTEKIKENDRFVFKNEVIGKVAMVDKLTQIGLVVLILSKDIKSPNDRLDLNIADYKEPIVAKIEGPETINQYAVETYTIDKDTNWSISNNNVNILERTNRMIKLQGEIKGGFVLTADDGIEQYTKNIKVVSIF